jgi:putative transposase
MTTKRTIALAELAEKGAATDLLHDMIQFVAQRMSEMDLESLCAAFYGERRPERLKTAATATARGRWRHLPGRWT